MPTVPAPKSIVERSTIDRLLVSLNSGNDGLEVVSTTGLPLEPAVGPQFQGRDLVEELIRDMNGVDTRDPKLSYDRQGGSWTKPDYFTENYTRHAEEYKSPEVCTI